MASVNVAVIRVFVMLGQCLLLVFAQSAPSQKNGICDVKDGKLLCLNVTHLPKQLPNDIDYIHVVDSNLDRLKHEDLNSTSVETLKFERNVIGELREGAFRLLPNLKSLHMSDNSIHANLTWCLFFGLDNLTSLDLKDNRFNMESFSKLLTLKKTAAPVQYSKDFCRCETTADERISSPCEELTVLPKLQYLRLSCNPFIILPSDIFLPLRQSPVVSLSLRTCQLLYIDKDTWAPLQHLQKVYLKNKKDSKIDELARNIANMNPRTDISLDLSLNSLQGVPTAVLAPLNSTLVELILTGNNFRIIRRSSFPRLQALEYLNLVACGIGKIEEGAFAALPNLKYLDLSQNRLRKYVSMKLFCPGTSGLKELRKMELNKCHLRSIEAGAFSALQYLQHLDLSGNQLEIDNDEVFSGLTSMSSLLLHDNRISFKGAKSPFKTLGSLLRLQLNKNFITHLTNDLFLGLDNLETLILRDNNIRYWNWPVLGATRNLYSLRLSRNELMEVTEAMLTDFAILRKLDISENPFKCNCELHIFHRWAVKHQGILQGWRKEEAYMCWTKNRSQYSLLFEENEIFRDCPLGLDAREQKPLFERPHAICLAVGISVLVVVVFIVGCFACRRGRRKVPRGKDYSGLKKALA
ncbi:unnamed protein product [Darwinula stevensoni]|uniref:Uncharacterized protein n=1 Tax=Darwinula stevensoni TaxID=69355 RepID=A0A7R8X622_9CRUS|nr:unnamed protein product [Darwinula stevensoni]CAG0885301.1 unnamed protein product [Darwinula stevensoni]